MEANRKLHNAIGLAMKAGKLRSGDFAVEKLVRAHGAKLVLLDAGASDNTRDKYAYLCKGADTPLLTVPSLGTAIGKPARMVAAVTDDNFQNLIRSALPEGGAEDSPTRG